MREMLRLVLIFNGVEKPCVTDLNSTLEQILQAEIDKNADRWWHVRHREGYLLEMTRKLKDFGFRDGERLFVSLGKPYYDA